LTALTPEADAATAKAARERHRLVVDLLVAAGAPEEAAEADAEAIEHYVSAATLLAFERSCAAGGALASAATYATPDLNRA
jgi:DtxR family manganese transport transcriptional regulator